MDDLVYGLRRRDHDGTDREPNVLTIKASSPIHTNVAALQLCEQFLYDMTQAKCEGLRITIESEGENG